MDVIYNGPHDGVELVIGDEAVIAERGKPISVPDEIGEGLLVQGLPEPTLDEDGHPKAREIPDGWQPTWMRAESARKPRRGDGGDE